MKTPHTAIVLVGGLGTRLRALYPDRPKALVPLNGRPFIAWMVDWLRHHGLRRIPLAAGHRAGQLEEWRRAQPADADLTLAQETAPLGTGGGLRFAATSVADETFLVVNGDSFLPGLDLRAWLAATQHRQAMAEIAVTRMEQPGRYGTVEFDKDGRVRAFLEKVERPSGWVNGGLYWMHRDVLHRIPAQGANSLEQDVFPSLAAEGVLTAHATPPPLLDMGTPEGLAAMEDFLRKHPLT